MALSTFSAGDNQWVSKPFKSIVNRTNYSNINNKIKVEQRWKKVKTKQHYPNITTHVNF